MLRPVLHDVLIAFGGNIGEVEATFETALEYLMCDLLDIRMSKIYQSAAVYDKPGTVVPEVPGPDYLDAVVRAKTFHSPQSLMERLLDVEKRLGRIRPAPECSPRTIDLDLLLFDDCIIEPERQGDLQIPHPRMHQRLFVLNPACDVAPEWIHPVLNQPLSEIRDNLI